MLGSGAPGGAKGNPRKRICRTTRRLRKFLGIDNQHTPNLLEVLGKLSSAIPHFKLKIVSDTRYPKIEAWTDIEVRTIFLTERVLTALLFGQPRARFTVAHEIGHLVLRHDDKNFRRPVKIFEKDEIGRVRRICRRFEHEANRFASTFLMPSHLVEAFDKADDIAKKFHVSLQAAKIRTKELKKCDGQEDVGWDKGTFKWANAEDLEPTRVAEQKDTDGTAFVFVAMDFDLKFLPFYRNVIKPIIEECGINCQRGDEFLEPGAVSDQIQKAVCGCSILIADITDLNPNVIMEVGMAIAVNKPIVLICRADITNDQIPYDMQHLRRLSYTEDAAGGVRLRRELSTAIQRVLTA